MRYSFFHECFGLMSTGQQSLMNDGYSTAVLKTYLSYLIQKSLLRAIDGCYLWVYVSGTEAGPRYRLISLVELWELQGQAACDSHLGILYSPIPRFFENLASSSYSRDRSGMGYAKKSSLESTYMYQISPSLSFGEEIQIVKCILT